MAGFRLFYGLFFGLFWISDMARQARLEQRSIIKFLCHQGNTPIQCWRGLEAVYGDRALGKTQVRAWHKTFRNGDLQTSTKDKAHTGRPRSGRSQTNIATVDTQLQQDRRQSIRDISRSTGIARATVQRILRKDLKLRHVSSKFVPRILTDEQKAFRVRLSQDNLDRFEQEGVSFLQRIVTGDESSLHTFDPDTKIKDSQWIRPGDRRPRKALHSRTRQSTMITTFFDCNGMMEWGTIRSEDYCQVLARLWEKICKKCLELWVMKGDWRTFLLHHDNATPTQEF